MIHEPVAVCAVLAGVIFVAIRLTARFKWAEKLSTVLWILTLAAVASNTGLIPTESATYDHLIGFTVQFAVCLVLFTVDLRDLRRAGTQMLVAAGLAILGTVAGVLCASLVLAPWLRDVLGADAWKVAGPFTGTYIGGSINFVSLWEGLELDRGLMAAANAVDNVTLFPLYAIWMVAAGLFEGRFPVAARWRRAEVEPAAQPAAQPAAGDARLVVGDVVALCLLALSIMAVTRFTAAESKEAKLPVPEILIVTTLALICGQLERVRRLAGAWQLGQLAFFLFFAAIGALIDLHKAITLSPILFLYVMLIIAVHMVVLYGGGRLLRLDLGVLTIASVATKTGPPMVLAMAEQRPGWQRLALPGVVVGLAGYALGNYAGFAVAWLVRAIT